MQDINTYLVAGWDFVDETTNGTCQFWRIRSGEYPSLSVLAGIIPAEPDGSGIPGDPYRITDANELGTIWYRPMASYHLDNSIDLSGIQWSSSVVPWFSGSFDGDGHAISHLRIKGIDRLGLFGSLDGTGSITRLGLENVDVNGLANNVGALVGQNWGGSIASSYSTGTVNGGDRIGGLAGSNYGDIMSSYSTCMVSGDDGLGGVVGSNSGEIIMSYSTCMVSGREDIGGLVGQNWGDITSSNSTCTVSGDNLIGGLAGFNSGRITSSNSIVIASGAYNVGGLVGSSSGPISLSHSMGAVSGVQNIGGLVGSNGNDITESYSTCAVTGDDRVGGLVGDNWESSIMASYSTGTASGKDSIGGLVGYNRESSITSSYSSGTVNGTYRVGGLVGYECNSVITLSFWDTETSGLTYSAGGTGLSTAQMHDINTFLNAGWDFVGETENGTDDIWFMPENDYPQLVQ